VKAIDKLRKSGLSTAQIADGIGCGEHLIRAYERYQRFPSKRTYLCIVELAEANGLTLLARDFLEPAAVCEPNGGEAYP
jgi:ribosome-binding protein aMBF1 (putative translation factor)